MPWDHAAGTLMLTEAGARDGASTANFMRHPSRPLAG
ncbi:MAG: hypothetical protein GEV13_18660 [Rhodospirillales bacterium]|nr:hypothetical protein [Rhodospirillales bacterium]